jgi:hypothetical protein
MAYLSAEKEPRTHWKGSWADKQNIPAPTVNIKDSQISQPVAQPLKRLSYRGLGMRKFCPQRGSWPGRPNYRKIEIYTSNSGIYLLQFKKALWYSRIPQSLQLQELVTLSSLDWIRNNTWSHECVDQCVCAVRAVDLPILVCLHSSCNSVTEVRER